MQKVTQGLLFASLTLFVGQGVFAHEVKTVTSANAINLGVAQHQHLQSASKYGGTHRTGHGAQVGESGIIIWSAKEYNGYGSTQTRNKHYRGGFKGQQKYGRVVGREYGKDTRND